MFISLTTLSNNSTQIFTFKFAARLCTRLLCQSIFAYLFVYILAPRRIWIPSFIWNTISICYFCLNILKDNNHPKFTFTLISTWLPVLLWISRTPFANIIRLKIDRMDPSWWVPIFSLIINVLKSRNNRERSECGRFLDILFHRDTVVTNLLA